MIEVIPCPDPVIHTMIHENNSTITVRIAVATSESVFLIPHFARIAVIPAKKEEPIAYKIHIFHASSLDFFFFYIIAYFITAKHT